MISFGGNESKSEKGEGSYMNEEGRQKERVGKDKEQRAQQEEIMTTDDPDLSPGLKCTPHFAIMIMLLTSQIRNNELNEKIVTIRFV